MMLELAEAFLYINSSRELWLELTERFGDSNGPLLYQLEKEISELYQGNDSVTVYYTKLKKLWEDLNDFSDVPECKCATTCEAVKKILANVERQKLMHFLMHLNDEYESVRSQILLLDPLRNVNKAYAMIQRVEKQRQVTNGVGVVREIAANVRKGGNASNTNSEPISAAFSTRNSGRGRRDVRDTKAARYCMHCMRSGHTVDQYFKLVSYPDWYKGL